MNDFPHCYFIVLVVVVAAAAVVVVAIATLHQQQLEILVDIVSDKDLSSSVLLLSLLLFPATIIVVQFVDSFLRSFKKTGHCSRHQPCLLIIIIRFRTINFNF